MRVFDNGIYRDMTAEEMAELNTPSTQDEIAELKKLLESTDYKAIKYAEGVMSEEEFSPIRTQRQAWRARINELEEKVIGGDTE